MIFGDWLALYHRLKEEDVEPTLKPGYFKVKAGRSGDDSRFHEETILHYLDGGSEPFRTWKRLRRSKSDGNGFGKAFREGVKL